MKNNHDLSNRQLGYARYLLKLTSSRRNDILAQMRPALRTKMRDFLLEARAEQLAEWHDDVRSIYLRKLHRENSAEFELLLSKVELWRAELYRRYLHTH